MPDRRTGLRRKIWIAFILQAAAISFAAVLGVYGASAVLKHVLTKRALQEEAAHFWDRGGGAAANLPSSFHLDAFLVDDAADRAALPADLRELPAGFHSLPRTQGGALVLVDDAGDGRTLVLKFKQQRLDDLAFWFGVLPLALVLAVIYVIAWSTYRASKRAVSPIVWLAGQVKQWDPKNPQSSALKPENLPVDVEGETLVLASSLHEYSSRIGAVVEREREFTRDASHELRTPLAVIRVAGDMMSADEGSITVTLERGRVTIADTGVGMSADALSHAFEPYWVADGRTLVLKFKQQRLDDLAFWFGVLPLALVLAVIYVIAWSTYRASKRAVSPIVWLAGQVKQWDPKNPQSSVLKPENLPLDVEGETLVLASSLHDYTSRIGAFVERERDFTRDASHELRTPLAVIRVAGDMMAADDGLSPMSRRALKRIQGAGRDMEALIEAFLILAREEDTGLPDDDFAVGDILDEEVERTRVMLGAKPVTITLVKNEDFHLMAPPRVVSVLVANLLRNASQYTDEGSITVTLDRGRVTIADTGVGMSPEALSHAFEPYWDADGRKPGQGLGLSIVRRLSHRFGWHVALDSTPGRGTTATLTFPDHVRP